MTACSFTQLVDPTCATNLCTQLMDPTRSPNLWTRLVEPSNKSCSRLDLWINSWSLKKQGVVPDWTSGWSRCGRCLTHGLSLRGALKTTSCSALDSHMALKTGRCSKSDPQIVFSFFVGQIVIIRRHQENQTRTNIQELSSSYLTIDKLLRLSTHSSYCQCYVCLFYSILFYSILSVYPNSIGQSRRS